MGYAAMMAAKAMADGWKGAASPQDKNSKQNQSNDSQMLSSLYSRAMSEELAAEKQEQSASGLGDKILSGVVGAFTKAAGKSASQGPSL